MQDAIVFVISMILTVTVILSKFKIINFGKEDKKTETRSEAVQATIKPTREAAPAGNQITNIQIVEEHFNIQP